MGAALGAGKKENPVKRNALGALLLCLGAVPLVARAEDPPLAPIPPVSLAGLYAPPPGTDLLPPTIAPLPHDPIPFYAFGDYQLWNLKPSFVPVPLLGTTTRTVDQKRVAPNLARAGFAPLFGKQNLDFGPASGAGGGFGWAPTAEGDFGVEFAGFEVPRTTTARALATGANGTPALFLPFQVRATNGTLTPSGLPLTGLIGGRIVPGGAGVSDTSEMWSAEIMPSLRLYHTDTFSFDFMAGFRHFGLSDEFNFTAASFNGAETFAVHDRYVARNFFWGGQVGARLGWAWEGLEATLTAKFAGGALSETLAVSGQTLRPASAIRTRRGAALVSGGFYSISSTGNTKNARWAVLPELGLNVSYRLTDCVYVTLGYDAFYLNRAFRAADQINPNISRSALPVLGGNFTTLPDPVFPKRQSEFWADGLNVGLGVRF